MRGQSAIISTILLSGIILSIVTATYIWGQPLIQKTTDKIKIDKIIDDLTIIYERLDHTQQTGSPSEVTLNVQEATYQISQEDNAILVKATTLIPVITSFSYVPISYTELAYETMLTDVNTSRTITDLVNTPTGYDEGTIHFGNVTLNGTVYNITVYNTSNTIFDHVCLYQGIDVTNTTTECAEELSSIKKGLIDYTVSWIDDTGIEVILSGGEEENIGVLGTDPAGIISGKSQPVSNEQHVTIKLSYRGLRDSTGRTYKTYIECSQGCRTGTGITTLRIERTRVERTTNSTNYYVNAYFE
ncbi:MAG: hypothetical protein WC307_00380 [Candidatus Nanoarchaeia archaeon]|jgi:hypothetical protein